MKRIAGSTIAASLIVWLTLPVLAGIDTSWDWPDDPETGKPRREIRIKYDFPPDTKLGDAKLSDVMDQAISNWNSVEDKTGWKFKKVGASETADVTIKSEDHNLAGGAVTHLPLDKNKKVKPGQATIAFDPTPPGYSWDQAGKPKDDTKNPVSCAKHELSHLLRLSHQGGKRSVSHKLKDPQGKDTKNDDVTTVSQDDIDEAKKSSTAALVIAGRAHPGGGDDLLLPGFAEEIPSQPVTPNIRLNAPVMRFGAGTLRLSRYSFETLPDPCLEGSGLHGRLLKGVEVVTTGASGPPVIGFDIFTLEIPFEPAYGGYGFLFECGDPDYGPTEPLSIRPVVWDERAGIWRPLRLGAPGLYGMFSLDTTEGMAYLGLPSFLFNAFPHPEEPASTRLLIGLAAFYEPETSGMLVTPDPFGDSMTGLAVIYSELPAPPGGLTYDVFTTSPFLTSPGTVTIPEGERKAVGEFWMTLLPPTHVLGDMHARGGGDADSFFDIFTEIAWVYEPCPPTRIGEPMPLAVYLFRLSDMLPLPDRPILFSVGGSPAAVAYTDHEGRAQLMHLVNEGEGAGMRQLIIAFLGEVPEYGALANLDIMVEVLRGVSALYTLDRTGTVGEPVILRGYLRRLPDNAWIVGREVAFYVDGVFVGSGTTNESGRADLSYVVPSAGSMPILAEFAGDAAYEGSSGSATLVGQVHGTKMATFDRTARITDRTELKCRLVRTDNTPIYGKFINFYVEGTFVISRMTNVSGYASYPFYDVPDGAGAGLRTILSEWPGDGGYLPVSKTATLNALHALPYIWVMPRSVPKGQVARLYAYFRRLYDYAKQEGKPVSWSIDGTWIGDSVTGTTASGEPGVARFNYDTSGLELGSHTVRCEWAGDAWVEPGYGQANLTIY